jgi:superfamily I DNA/RNA helicase
MLYKRTRVKDVLFLAYNKSIADELSCRGLNTQTMHGLGNALCKQHLKKYRINKNKVVNILKYKVKIELTTKEYEFVSTMSAGLRRMQCKNQIAQYDQVTLDELCEELKLDMIIPMPELQQILMAIHPYMDVSCYRVIDFTDMLILPLRGQWEFPTYKLVFVDEVQDLNAPQQEYVYELYKKGARIILAGDPHQTIYGFRGAVSQGFQRMGTNLNATLLKLSKSFRCPPEICEAARNYSPDIEAYFNKVGSVQNIPVAQLDWAEELKNSDAMILCRKNAPLFKLAIQLLSMDIACHVVGADIAAELLGLLQDATSMDIVWENLNARLAEAQANSWIHKEEYFHDMIELLHILDTHNCVETLRNKIKCMFNAQGVPLLTIHKSKGLEANKVILLQADFLETSNRQVTQEERNLMYVAITRAKTTLILTTEDKQ